MQTEDLGSPPPPDKKIIDVREEIANAPIGQYHYLIAILIGLVVFFDGFDMFNGAYVIHYVVKPWHLDPSQTGLLLSSSTFGTMIGALLEGKFSDRFGRRASLLAALWSNTIFSFATAVLAHSYITFCLLRLGTGIGVGVLLPVGVTYMNEYAPKRFRHTFSLWSWAFGFAAGGVAASAVGVFLTPILGWQALFYVASLSVVLALICHVALPESLQFAAMRGKMADVAKILSRLLPANAALYNSPAAQFVFPEPNDRVASVSLLLSPVYRRATLALWAAAFCMLFTLVGLNGWIPTVMIQRGEAFTVGFGYGALLQISGFIGSLVCGYISDRSHGTRQAISVWGVGGAVALTALALFNNHALNFLCLGAAGFCMNGAQNMINSFSATVYDTEVRGTGVGMTLGIGRLGGISGPIAIGVIQQISPGTTGLFEAVALASLVGAIAILFAQSARPARKEFALTTAVE